MDFPIHGFFKSKRGIGWSFTIYNDLTVEQYHSTTERSSGGWKMGKDIFVKPTKELKQIIKEEYGLDVK